ncbi:MAG: peptidoglycan-binding protein [Muribaculaceae bacterium]|nr:peptidoglycan-binding protein [Muribaculaceae bacterium]
MATSGTLQYRLSSTEIKTLQRQLKALGCGNLNDDGLYGPMTSAAVARFCNQRRLQYDVDSRSLVVLRPGIVMAIHQAYQRQPKMYASGPILKSASGPTLKGPNMTSLSANGIIPELPDIVSELYDDTCSIIESLLSEIKLMGDLKTKNPQQIIAEFKLRITPKLTQLQHAYDNIHRKRRNSRVSKGTKQFLRSEYNHQVNNITSIAHWAERKLKGMRLDKKIKAAISSNAGKKLGKAAGPAGIVISAWDALRDLFYLACGLLKGVPIDDEWRKRFEKDLCDLADGIIVGLVAELVVAGIVAAGIVAGTSIVVIAIITIVVAIILGFVCDKLDFSPTKFFSQLLAKLFIIVVGDSEEDRVRRELVMHDMLYQT